MKLYRLDVECPKCDKRPHWRCTDVLREAIARMDPRAVIMRASCGVERCHEVYPIRARAVHQAVYVENASFAAPILNLDPLAVPLSERQAEICALVAEGLSDARITLRLGIPKPTVRYHVQEAARRICDADESARRAFPRRTIEAYYRARANALLPDAIFKNAA